MSIQHASRITSGYITKSNVASVSRTRIGSTVDSNLCLLFNGTVGTTSFVDSSPDARTITTAGNSTTSDTQTKFGNVLYVDGNGDYLTWAADTEFNLGTNDHTTECWFYRDAYATDRILWSINNSTNSSAYSSSQFVLRADGSAVWLCASGATTWINTSNVATAGTLVSGAWTHIACVRNGSDFSVYKNGVRIGGYTSSSSIHDFNQLSYLACRRASTSPQLFYQGYITNFRFTRAALYTADFTPSDSPLAASGIPAGTITVTNDIYGMRKNY